MKVGIPKEVAEMETRVAATPETVRKLIKKGFSVLVEKDAGRGASFPDSEYKSAGAEIGATSGAWVADIIFKISRPTNEELLLLKPGSLLFGLLEPYRTDDFFTKLAELQVNAAALELLPRSSRAQSMDVLSSQANIAGYRAVIEAARLYGRFFPMMMTSAGSAKPARLAVLGVGVAGLQAISTARRLGAVVEAYDVRPEVREQIVSVGAKVIEVNVGETGSGEGGYAGELSEEAKVRQQQILTEKLKKFDIIVSTANIPGKKSPILISEEAIRAMRPGSVVIDMAASNGGNCALTEMGRTVQKQGVWIVGITNYPALVPSDSSAFFGNNLVNLLSLFSEGGGGPLQYNLDDEIVSASLVTLNGEVRKK